MSNTIEIHDQKVEVVQAAVIGLLDRFGDQGLTATAIFEGALKAGAVVMLAERGASLHDVADLLHDFANALVAAAGGFRVISPAVTREDGSEAIRFTDNQAHHRLMDAARSLYLQMGGQFGDYAGQVAETSEDASD